MSRVEQEIAAIAVSDQNEKLLQGMAEQIATYWHTLRKRGVPVEVCQELTLQTNQTLLDCMAWD